jgi:hypothetical protein
MIGPIRLSLLVGISISNSVWAGNIVLFNDLGAGSAVYQTGGGWEIKGPTSSCVPAHFDCGEFDSAFSFKPVTSSYFTELQIGLGYVSGTNSVIVNLNSDLSGSPGAILESWNISGLPSYLSCCTLQTMLGDGTIPLVSGMTYWITIQPSASDTSALWLYNPSGSALVGPGQYSTGSGWLNNGDFDILGAFEVQGSAQASPEPGTALLVIAGAGAWFVRMRKGRRF